MIGEVEEIKKLKKTPGWPIGFSDTANAGGAFSWK
jgi:hypothetical protein